jgi:6,7-dimethyl-8-ribityllumazine synthase
MATKNHDLSKNRAGTIDQPEKIKIGVIVSDWNAEITHKLLDACCETLMNVGIPSEQIQTIHVPGAFELPAGARMLDDRYNVDALICLGCVIKGETSHDEYINQAVANGLMQLGVLRSKPFIFGVLTTNDFTQAQERAGGTHGNKGVEAAHTAIKMIDLKKQMKSSTKTIGF